MASDDAVEQLVHFSEEIFKANAIISPDVQRAFCRELLNNGKLFDATNQKFDVVLLAGLVTDGEPAEEVNRATYHLNVAIPEEHVQMMSVFHPNVRIVNGVNTTHPHATAQAHRALDVRMMVKERATMGKLSLLDIGGNYITHPKMDVGKGMEIHCCTLRAGWIEHHRQTQRDVSVLQGYAQTGKCHDGVQNCDFYAEAGMCVHVLPEIPPDDWPMIFRNHGLRSVTSVHHYPSDIDNYERTGYMQYPGMHWERGADDMVTFHFDSDSSFAYKHRYDWLKEYGKSWVRTSPGWEYAVYYEVKVLKHGMLYSEMTRLPVTQITMHSPHTKLLYVGGETDVMVPVPVYNKNSGLAITNPAAYDTVHYPVPERMYTWCMCKGISNDTSKPDQPYSRNEMRSAVRAINRDRALNGLKWSERLQMSTETCEIIGDGIYTSVVVQTAYNKMLVSKLASQMQRMQKRWGTENLVRLMTKAVSLTVVLPFILLSTELQDVVDILRITLGKGVYSHEALLPPQHRVPYVELGVMTLPAGMQESDPEGVRQVFIDDKPDLDSRELKLNYYYTFKDQMTDDQKLAMEQHLFPDGKVHDVPLPPPVFVEDDADIDDQLPSREETWKAITDNREKWLDEFKKLREEADEELFVDTSNKEPQVGTLQDVHKYDRQALMEYALHCFDLHQSTHANALDLMARHWRGTRPDFQRMSEDNEKDIGAVFLTVDDNGFLMGVPDGTFYDQVVDPVTRKFIDVQRRQAGMYVGTVQRHLVYALDSLRISNSKRMGLVAMNAFRAGFDLSDVEVHLIDGIAGAGKTNEIKRRITPRDVLATAPRASAESIRKWCMQQDRFKGMDTTVQNQYRTMDSHLLAKTPRIGEKTFVDEGFMLPYGATVLLLIRSGSKTMYMSGDNAQIGMIDRGAGYGSLLYTKQMFFTSIAYLNTTDRCPQDMTYLIRQYYPEWRRPLIKTRSPIRRSIRVEVIPNAESEVYKTPMPMATYLTFTQGDKGITAKYSGFVDAKKLPPEVIHPLEATVRPVLSVHESQGETYPFVVIHRLNKYSNAIFKSLPHRYVSHSRHLILCILRTVSDASMCDLTKCMMSAVNLTDEQLDSVIADDLNESVTNRIEEARAKLGKYMNLG